MMSNHLAIAQAGEALKRFLARSVTQDVGYAVDVVTRKPPTEPPDGPMICIFLYQVTPNGALRNQDLPTRDVGGRLLRKPQAALNLHYLVSFYGNEDQLQPQALLGSVARALHAEPTLSRADLEDAATAVYLAGADLAEAVERVRLTPTKLEIDDLSKLWSMLHQTPFAVSMVYEAAVVLLDGPGVPTAGRPVLERRLRVLPYRSPIVNRLLAVDPEGVLPPREGPVPKGHAVHLVGTDLNGEGVAVRIGTEPVLTPTEVRADRLVFVPGDSLAPGVYPVRVRHEIGLNGTTRPLESNVVALIRQPTVESASVEVAGNVTVRLDLPVRADQRVSLLLDNESDSYRFEAPFPLPEPREENSVVVPVSAVRSGGYLVRVQVDGVESRSDLTEPTVRL